MKRSVVRVRGGAASGHTCGKLVGALQGWTMQWPLDQEAGENQRISSRAKEASDAGRAKLGWEVLWIELCPPTFISRSPNPCTSECDFFWK